MFAPGATPFKGLTEKRSGGTEAVACNQACDVRTVTKLIGGTSNFPARRIADKRLARNGRIP